MDRSRYDEQGTRPIASVAQAALVWVVGSGLLRLHAAIFAVAAAGLLAINLIQNPDDLWAPHALKLWLIALACHLAAVVAGWGTWRAIRPHRIEELSGTLPSLISTGSDEPYEPEPLPELLTAGAYGTLPADWQGEHVEPVAARGRFTPHPDDDSFDERGWMDDTLDRLREAGQATLTGARRFGGWFVGLFVREEEGEELGEAAGAAPPVETGPPTPAPTPDRAATSKPTAPGPEPIESAPSIVEAPVWQTAPTPVVTELAANGAFGSSNGHHHEPKPPMPQPGTDRSWMETAASAWVVRTDPALLPHDQPEPKPDPATVTPTEGEQPAAGAG